MNKLAEIKDEYAKEEGYSDFSELYNSSDKCQLEAHMCAIAHNYAMYYWRTGLEQGAKIKDHFNAQP